MKNSPHNWRASQMRYWHMKPREDQLTADWREWCNIVGDAAFVVPATEENVKIMESLTRKQHCYGPAPDIRGTVHPYWVQRKKQRESSRKRQAPSPKRQATSRKPVKLFAVDMCRK